MFCGKNIISSWTRKCFDASFWDTQAYAAVTSPSQMSYAEKWRKSRLQNEALKLKKRRWNYKLLRRNGISFTKSSFFHWQCFTALLTNFNQWITEKKSKQGWEHFLCLWMKRLLRITQRRSTKHVWKEGVFACTCKQAFWRMFASYNRSKCKIYKSKQRKKHILQAFHQAQKT